YMAAGRPTALAIDGVIRDVIEASHGGIFSPPGDDAALADAILQLADNPARARQMGAAAREYVVQNFNRRDQAMDFLQLLRSVAGARPEVAASAGSCPRLSNALWICCWRQLHW